MTETEREQHIQYMEQLLERVTAERDQLRDALETILRMAEQALTKAGGHR